MTSPFPPAVAGTTGVTVSDQVLVSRAVVVLSRTSRRPYSSIHFFHDTLVGYEYTDVTQAATGCASSNRNTLRGYWTPAISASRALDSASQAWEATGSTQALFTRGGIAFMVSPYRAGSTCIAC
jgi:hypothetical protein